MTAKLGVLFVCFENSNRSQMAEALARIHGGGQVEALSAGSKPSGQSCPGLPARCREDWGLPDPKHMDDDGYRAVRDEISIRAKNLLAAMS